MLEVTLYETSVINKKAFYTITPIPIIIYSSNPGQCRLCSDLNHFQGVPQPSNPSPRSPWLTSECSTGATVTNNPTSTQAHFITVSPSCPERTVTLTIGGTATKTITFVVVHVETLTEISSGLTTTTTCVHNLHSCRPLIGALCRMTMSKTPEVEPAMGSIEFVGFIPINAAKRMTAVATLMAGCLTMLTVMTLLTLL